MIIDKRKQKEDTIQDEEMLLYKPYNYPHQFQVKYNL